MVIFNLAFLALLTFQLMSLLRTQDQPLLLKVCNKLFYISLYVVAMTTGEGNILLGARHTCIEV